MLLTALRTMEDAFTAALLAEPLAHNLSIFQVAGHIDFRRNIRGLVVVALDESGNEFLLIHIETLVQNELASANRAPLAHDENAGARNGLLAVETDQVDIHACGENHLLAIVEAVDDLEAALDAPRALKVQIGGSFGHIVFEFINQFAAFARKKALNATNVSRILLAPNHACAHTGTAAHMIIKARAALLGAYKLDDVTIRRLFLKQTTHVFPPRAGCAAYGHNLTQGIDHVACGARIRIGTKIACSRFMTLARVFDGRKQVALGYRDKGIALIVFKVNIKVRMVLADQVTLEHQRLVLGLDNDVVETGHQLHHERNLLAIIGERHVLLHACTEVFGLTHVDNLAGRVFP